MVKFILRTLLGVPAWLLYFVLMLPLIAIGFPLVAVLALLVQWNSRRWGHVRPGILQFPKVFGVRLFYLWENDEDGIDGDPWIDSDEPPKNPEWFEATASWSVWRKVFVWSAWRNSVGNARRMPFFGMTMTDPKDTVVYTPNPWDAMPNMENPNGWPTYRKLGPYLARYGYRFELRFPWPQWAPFEPDMRADLSHLPQRYFWIGWRIAQQDQPNTDIGFAFQPWAKL